MTKYCRKSLYNLWLRTHQLDPTETSHTQSGNKLEVLKSDVGKLFLVLSPCGFWGDGAQRASTVGKRVLKCAQGYPGIGSQISSLLCALRCITRLDNLRLFTHKTALRFTQHTFYQTTY